MTEPAKLRDVAIPVLLKAAVSAFTLGTGFRAISDDDYARIVIAERFAASPAWDPSGTSWLPFPFWLTGSVMTVLGPSVSTARAVAFVMGMVAVALVWLAARCLGASRRAAIWGACVAAIFPYSAWTGVATVPELWSAALLLLGAASLSRADSARLWGGLGLAAACLCRYEAWPVAALFTIISLWDAARHKSSLLVSSAVLALAAPLGWLAHGAAHHGDALFFVSRVSDYRRAVGSGGGSILQTLAGYPSLLMRSEPELAVVAAIALLTALGVGVKVLGRHARLAGVMGLLLGFLIAGELGGGAPTHHAERALIAIWLWLAVLAADAATEAWSALRAGKRALLVALTGLVVAPAAGIARPWYARRDGFVDRDAEIRIGEAARHRARPGERLLVDSPDYGFFAIMAGFGGPERAEPFDDHDPRKPKPLDAFASSETLRARIDDARASWVVVTSRHEHVIAPIAVVAAREAGLVLCSVNE